ncbi:acid phosphatase/Vanadium-dependent haloperoxidase [Meredithblackwellia eburnea MCA 4105]
MELLSPTPSLPSPPLTPPPPPLKAGPLHQDDTVPVGLLTEEQLAPLLPKWRILIRRSIQSNLEREMPILVAIQKKCRTPFLDTYFQWSSLLGSHTFFMLFIPMWFWFGHPSIGRGLLYVLAAGGYLTSVLKDLFCVARPFSPPLVRLSVGNHAAEYGFPSTHSTNSVSMALYFGEIFIVRLAGRGRETWVNWCIVALMTFFALTVTFGRIYCAMHSILDVLTGSIIGALIWLGYYFAEDAIDKMVLTPGWGVTVLLTPLVLLLITLHPHPAEFCPCFEDAVAFISVVLGIVLGRNWYPRDFERATVGAEWTSWWDVGVWSAGVGGKLVFGILTIFAWRLLAKSVSHAILPPLIRFFSPFILPRRHYVVATEYDDYPTPEPGLHPIPSILDLPSLDDLEESTTTLLGDSEDDERDSKKGGLRNRFGNGSEEDEMLIIDRVRRGGAGEKEREKLMMKEREKDSAGKKMEEGRPVTKKRKCKEEVVRHDADVLTKVIVYSGIGWFATIAVPFVLEEVGLSV